MSGITLHELTKKFDELLAVDKVSLTVKSGELFGLLGPNGAGKTTFINMLTTLLKPTSGRALVAGFDVERDPENVRRNIGIVFQDPSLDTGLTGKENLNFHAMMYGIDADERKKRIAEVLSVVGLTEKANLLVETYSGGMKRRLEIARGLIHHPRVLFLDEPTLGLDAQTRRKIWEYIKKLNREYKMSIVLTTHYMEEADYLCDRIAIIDHGKIIALDTPSQLKTNLSGDFITLVLTNGSADLVSALQRLPWVKEIKSDSSRVSLIITEGETRIPELINITHTMGIDVASVTIHKSTLEDVFLHFTGSSIRDREQSRSGGMHEAMARRMRR